MSTQQSKFKAIADKIRSYLVTDDLIKPSEFASKIDEVHTAGYGIGLDDGIEQGKQSQYDEFWDNFQNYGKRADYSYAFGIGWNNKNFKPKYNMQPTTLTAAFDGMQCTDCDFRELGINIDYVVCSNFQSAFRGFTGLTAIEIGYTGYASNFDQCFYGCTGLSYLKLGVHAGLNFYNNAFYNCTALTDLTITGTIGKLINLKWSPLNKASITSVINALSSTTSGLTVTFKKTAVEAAFPHIFAATFSNETQILDTIGTENFDYVIWAMGIGDYAEIGEYVYISFADTNVVLQKTGDSVQEASGINEGEWSLIAYGTDIKDEWGELVSSKPNWTISLV